MIYKSLFHYICFLNLSVNKSCSSYGTVIVICQLTNGKRHRDRNFFVIITAILYHYRYRPSHSGFWNDFHKVVKKAILRGFDNNTDPWLKHASKILKQFENFGQKKLFWVGEGRGGWVMWIFSILRHLNETYHWLVRSTTTLLQSKSSILWTETFQDFNRFQLFSNKVVTLWTTPKEWVVAMMTFFV